jgi:hypothetical protein
MNSPPARKRIGAAKTARRPLAAELDAPALIA